MGKLKELKIDEKWSIMYDPEYNDKPYFWNRYGGLHSDFEENNAVTAMFYAILTKENNNDS